MQKVRKPAVRGNTSADRPRHIQTCKKGESLLGFATDFGFESDVKASQPSRQTRGVSTPSTEAASWMCLLANSQNTEVFFDSGY